MQLSRPSYKTLVLPRLESNMLKKLPKLLPRISQKFLHSPIMLLSASILCLYYAIKLPTILSIIMENLKY